MKKIIEEIANEKRQEKEESLLEKYYQTFLSSMENVTLKEVPIFKTGLFKDGLSIKDQQGNEILLYEDLFSNYLLIEVTYADGFKSITKEKFNDKTKEWQVI